MLLVFSSLIVAVPGLAQTTTVWEIGKYDQSFAEFHLAARDQVLYQVGKNEWSKDWPGAQNTGSRYEIQFPLDKAPRGAFTLKIALFAITIGKIPALSVEVNGHKGLFYLHPKWEASTIEPRPPSELLSIDIPLEYLQTGSNRVILSCSAARPSGLEDTDPSGIRYDALSLINDENAIKRDFR